MPPGGAPLATQISSTLPTGVPDLDVILGGGLPRGSLIFLVGSPGVGKTLLAMQVACHAVQAGTHVLVLTALSEPHGKLLAHVANFSFYDPEKVGNGLELLNLQSLLAASAEESVDGIVEMVRRNRTSLVVIDGFGGVGGFLQSDFTTARFLYELGAKLNLLGVTTIICSQADPRETAPVPEFTVADGLLALYYERSGNRHRRYLEVLKLRGMAHFAGLHTLRIGPDGLRAYPQAEALPDEPAPRFGDQRAGFDLPALDRMLGGGLNEGTATMLAGSPGTGKTLAALHFLAAGARRGESGLLLGFQESQAQLLARAPAFGLDLAGAVASGTVQLVNCSPFWLDPDVIASETRARVNEGGIRRLVIDSSREIERSLDPARAPEYLAALVGFLRSRRVTILLTREIPKIVGAELDFSDSAAAVLAENVILLRHVEYRAELHRIVSVLKMRFSDHDRGLYEFTVSDRGIAIGNRFNATEGILTGIARGTAVEAP